MGESMEIREYVYPQGSKPETTVLWASRHSPLPAQLHYLYNKLGPIRIVQVAKVFSDANEIISLAKTFNAKYIVPVIPLSMILRLVENKNSFTILWAEMELVRQSNQPITPNPECKMVLPTRDQNGKIQYKLHRFKCFKVIKAIKFELQPL